jgi:protein XRP2
MKLNKKDFIFENKQNETLYKQQGEINGLSFCVRNLQNCVVYLKDFISSVYILNCENCRIFTGPVSNSIFIRECKNSFISLAAQQVWVSNCSHLTLNLFSLTDLTLEQSKSIVLEPYSFVYKGINEHFIKANIDGGRDNFGFRVLDFTP